MKTLGTISIFFGLGLIAVFIYGSAEEISSGRLFKDIGTLFVFLTFLSGFCVTWFSAKTIFRDKIHNASESQENILDLPEHIKEEENNLSVGAFTLVCGYISLVSGLLSSLYFVYTLYSIAIILFYEGGMQFIYLVFFLLFLGSICNIIYTVRKLFFSGK